VATLYGGTEIYRVYADTEIKVEKRGGALVYNGNEKFINNFVPLTGLPDEYLALDYEGCKVLHWQS